MKLRSVAAALSIAASLTPLPSAAADQIEIVLTGAASARGLGGNDVCRIQMKMKNRTAFRLENLTFKLIFPELAYPALGGMGIPFLSPASLGSDQEDTFTATWHQGRCQAAHYQTPTLSPDTCVIGNLSERDCKTLFSLRSQLQKPAAMLALSDVNLKAPVLTDANLKGIDCRKLADTNVKLKASIRIVGAWLTGPQSPFDWRKEVLIDRAAGVYTTDADSDPVDVSVANGFNWLMTFRSRKPERRTHRFVRSIDVMDAKHNLPEQLTYILTKDKLVKATVGRIVTDLGKQTVGGCQSRAISVVERTAEEAGRASMEVAYVWYPDLKLRIDQFVRSQSKEEADGGLIEPRYWNIVARVVVTSLAAVE